jgi:hypothetical protein
MGKEFHTIDKGLDPAEVIEFLKTAVGSSEDSFKRLEQFSALQAAARAMDESIAQAKQLAESAKKQAEAEAQQERERTLQEAREQAEEMVEQAKNSCNVLIDDVRTVLTDAIHGAFEKAKETVATNLSDLDSDINWVGASHHNQILVNRQQPEDSLSTPATDTTAQTTPDKTDDDQEEELESDLTDLQRSLADLESSLTSLHVNTETTGDTSEIQFHEESDQNIESKDEMLEAKEEESKSENDSRYVGEVLVAIPGGASESWMQELREQTLKLPGARIKSESGMDDNTTIVMMALDEPVEMQAVLQSMPNVEKVVEDSDNNMSSDKGRMKLLQKATKKPKRPTFVVELDTTASGVPTLT